MSSQAGPAASCDSWKIISTTVPAEASTVTYGKPTICSGSSNVRKAPSPAFGSTAHAPAPHGVAALPAASSNEPGMRYSNQSRGSRFQTSRPERTIRSNGRSASRSTGVSRARRTDEAAETPPSAV